MPSQTFERTAEYMRVKITKKWPRRVEIYDDPAPGARPSIEMDMREAEGLLYALGAAIRDATKQDE